MCFLVSKIKEIKQEDLIQKIKFFFLYIKAFFSTFYFSLSPLCVFLMAATHDVHRFIEENLFGPFQRPSNTFHNSYRSLTASDLLSQRSASTTNRIPSSTIPQQYKCRPASDILQAKTKSSPEGEIFEFILLVY